MNINLNNEVKSIEKYGDRFKTIIVNENGEKRVKGTEMDNDANLSLL